jgi:nifR3 family TIM-barrel protein
MKTFKIGKIKLKNPLVLAPMVDVTDLPFRLLCRRAGAGLAFTEMVYIDALLHENAPTLRMVKTCKEDSPLGLQITGNDVNEFEEFVKRRNLWKDFDLIDLNCGCPSSRIIGTEAGSFLLKDPEKIAAIIRVLKKTKKIVSVKIRLGYLKNNVVNIAKKIEGAGADAITIHARLSNDPYAKKADWSWITKVKKEVKIPVIGNGDVFNGKDVKKLLDETNCDGVMIARAAIGDPLVFRRILDYLKTGNEKESSFKENFKQFEEYLKLEKKYFKNKADFNKLKYVGGKFLRGFRNAGKKRDEFMKLKNWSEIENFFKEFISSF